MSDGGMKGLWAGGLLGFVLVICLSGDSYETAIGWFMCGVMACLFGAIFGDMMGDD